MGKSETVPPVGRHLDTLQVYGNGWAVRTSVFFSTCWRSGSGWQNTSQSETAQSFSTSHLDPLSIACDIPGSIVQSNFDYFNHPVPMILTLMSTVAPGCVLLCQYMGKMAANECACKRASINIIAIYTVKKKHVVNCPRLQNCVQVSFAHVWAYHHWQHNDT